MQVAYYYLRFYAHFDPIKLTQGYEVTMQISYFQVVALHDYFFEINEKCSSLRLSNRSMAWPEQSVDDVGNLAASGQSAGCTHIARMNDTPTTRLGLIRKI